MNDPNVASKINFGKNTHFLIHGWRDFEMMAWYPSTATAWSKYADANVCYIDWSAYSYADYFTAALTNVQLASFYIYKYINEFLVPKGLSIKDTQIAGHSLGAQIAGFVGKSTNGKLNTIYGMDPAGPLFMFPFINPTAFRLDPTDAQWVQNIHTSAFVFGVGFNCGHQDFWPNFGFFLQPGCIWPFTGDYLSPPNNPVKCSHYKAIELFQTSLSNDKICSGVSCLSALNYLLHLCGSGRDVMGPANKKVPGEFYSLTTRSKPYCTGKDYF